MSQAMSVNLAMWTARRYVCARCWQHLLVTHHDGLDWVECSNAAHCDGQGYVTKRYAERRLEESYADKFDARKNLHDWLPKQPAKNEEWLLKELGF